MVSVIIPIFNVRDYLRKCIDSVLEQKYHDYEIILVEDGSTDGSEEIAEWYSNAYKRIRLVKGPRNGVASARNAGVAVARGELITFVDSDDVLHRKALLYMVNAMKHDVDIVAVRYTRDGSKLGQGSRRKSVCKARRALSWTLHQTHGTNTAVWGKLFRRSLFEGMRFKSGIIYEDLEILPKLMAKANKVVFLHQKLYYYRKRVFSYMNVFNNSRTHVLDVTEGLEDWVREQNLSLKGAARDRAFSAGCNIYLLASRFDPNHPARKRAWQMVRKRRLRVLFSPGVRIKNRLGAALSLFGWRFFYLFN